MESFMNYFNLVSPNYKSLGTYNTIQKVADLAGLIEVSEFTEDTNHDETYLIMDQLNPANYYKVVIIKDEIAEALRGLL